MTPPPRLLVVEDEPPMQAFLKSLAEGSGFELHLAATVGEATRMAAMHTPDVILLDLELPDGHGLEVVDRVRAWSQVPIIVVSARGRDDDKVRALDAGADDYLTKPFSAQELLARVRVALRHRTLHASEPDPIYQADGLTVDLARRQVARDEATIALTPTEYRILEHLVQHAGRVVTHRQILQAVWGPHLASKTHYVRVHVHQLRAKIERTPSEPAILHTEAGVGYRLVEPNDAPLE